MALEILVNSGWGNGLLPDGTKPLPEPLLTSYQRMLCGIHLKAMSLEVLMNFFCNIYAEIALLKLLHGPNLAMAKLNRTNNFYNVHALTQFFLGISNLILLQLPYSYALIQMRSGPWFNIKMSSYQYRKSHCGDTTVVRSSYLHSGISYIGKMSSLYWIRALLSTACILSCWTLYRNLISCGKCYSRNQILVAES